MIFELMDGSLDDLLRTGSYATGPRPISLDQLTRLVLEHVLSGLEYLHANGIVHRDIKPGNILYSCRNGVYRFCIGDFGSSNYATMARTNDVGTLIFMAPEIKRSGQLQSAKADIWSLFVTVLWIINHRQIRQSTVRCMSPEDISASTTSLADDLRVLGDMASIDPDQRPSAVELLHRIAGRHDPLSDRPHEDNGQNIALAGYCPLTRVLRSEQLALAPLLSPQRVTVRRHHTHEQQWDNHSRHSNHSPSIGQRKRCAVAFTA